MDAIERLRTRCWYEYVRGRFNGEPPSDYQLSVQFDPHCVTGADRVPLFERIRHDLPKLKNSLLDQVDLVYPGTKGLYLSPFWQVLGYKDLGIDELQQRIIEAVEVTQFYNLKVYIPESPQEKPKPRRINFGDNLEEDDRLRAITTRSIRTYLKNKLQMRASDTMGRPEFLVLYLGEVALVAGLYRYYMMMRALERAIVAKNILLDDEYFDIANITSPYKKSTVWQEVFDLCRHYFFDTTPDHLPKQTFVSLLKGKLEPDTLAEGLISELDIYHLDRSPSITNVPKLAVTTFHISEQLKAGLSKLQRTAEIAGEKRSKNAMMVDALNAYLVLSQHERKPSSELACNIPTNIRLPVELKILLEAESEFWERELGSRVSMGSIMCAAISHYLLKN